MLSSSYIKKINNVQIKLQNEHSKCKLAPEEVDLHAHVTEEVGEHLHPPGPPASPKPRVDRVARKHMEGQASMSPAPCQMEQQLPKQPGMRLALEECFPRKHHLVDVSAQSLRLKLPRKVPQADLVDSKDHIVCSDVPGEYHKYHVVGIHLELIQWSPRAH